MCERCDDLREKIERCHRMIGLVLDKLTVERLQALRSDYEMQLQKIECLNKKQPFN
jgi:hypothetical protein